VVVRKLNARRQSGQSLVEHLILWPVLVLLTLGSVQMGLLFRTKSTMNNATFLAARAGALNYGNKDRMVDKLAEAMTPLYLKKDPNVLKLLYQREVVKLDATLTVGLPFGLGPAKAPLARIDVISPSSDVVKHFEAEQYELVKEDKKIKEVKFKQIPNDNLNVRDTTTKKVQVAGQTVEMNIQDANLLKIRAHWCYPLEVPMANKIIWLSIKQFGGMSSPHWSNCESRTNNSELIDGYKKYYVPISAESTVRMQTPYNPKRGEKSSIF